MARITLIFYLICYTCTVEAQSPIDKTLRRFYDFDKYLVNRENYSITENDIIFTSDTRKFKTEIVNALKQKANYAGYCVFIEWGCGTECQQSAIIDKKTKKVIFGPSSSTGYYYYADSRLLISNPEDKDASDFILKKSNVYLLSNDSLIFLKTIDWK